MNFILIIVYPEVRVDTNLNYEDYEQRLRKGVR